MISLIDLIDTDNIIKTHIVQ